MRKLAVAVLLAAVVGSLVAGHAGHVFAADKRSSQSDRSDRAEHGRYQIFFNPNPNSYPGEIGWFLVDTYTGRVWQYAKDDNGQVFWGEMARVFIDNGVQVGSRPPLKTERRPSSSPDLSPQAP